MKVITELIHNKDQVLTRSITGKARLGTLKQYVAISFFCFAITGFVIGLFHSPLQALSASIKMPILFYGASVICLPLLYIFLNISQINVGLYSLVSFVIVSTTLSALIQLGMTPILLFFLISGTSYALYKVILIASLAISVVSALQVFRKHLYTFFDQQSTGLNEQKRSRWILTSWFVLYGLIGSNLSYLMSPFIAHPNEKFILFTTGRIGFISDIIHTF